MNAGSDLDILLDALANPYRRQLLTALREADLETGEYRDPLEMITSEQDDAALEAQLHHYHLPQLADRGYIEWNRDDNTVRKGPDWYEIELLLTLLYDHRDEFPDSWAPPG